MAAGRPVGRLGGAAGPVAWAVVLACAAGALAQVVNQKVQFQRVVINGPQVGGGPSAPGGGTS